MAHKAIKMSVVTKRVGKDIKSSDDCIQRHYWNTGMQEETSKEIEKKWSEEKEENQKEWYHGSHVKNVFQDKGWSIYSNIAVKENENWELTIGFSNVEVTSGHNRAIGLAVVW